MPTPRRQVETAPLPGVRKSAAETPLSAGVGVSAARSRAWGAAGELAQDVGAVVNTIQRDQIQQVYEARQRADQVAGWDSQNQLHAFLNQELYDPQTGAFQKKGKEAQALPEQVGERLDQRIGEISATLNPRQREAFDEYAAKKRVDVNEHLLRHAATEQTAFELETVKALVTNSRDEAIRNAGNPGMVDQALDQAVTAMITAAPRFGWGKETLDLELAKVRTATHIGVVQQLLAQHEENHAQIYFDEVKDQILNGDEKRDLIKQLEVGDILSDAQTAADQIILEGGTLEEQRAKAKARFTGKDGAKKREAALNLIEHEDGLKDRQAREAERVLFDRVYADARRTHRMPDDAVTLQQLGTGLPALEAYVDRLTRGAPMQTNWPRYVELFEESITDPEKFAKRNLLLDKHQIEDADFLRLEHLKAGIAADATAAAKAKAAPIVAGFVNQKELVEDTLWQYTRTPEKDYTKAQKDAKAQLLSQVDHWAAVEQADGKKVTNEQVRDKLHDILGRETVTKGSTWFGMFFESQGWHGPSTKALLDTTIDDISPADRKDLEAVLRQDHRPVTPQTILDLYLSIQLAPTVRAK